MATEWSYQENGQTVGPISSDQLKKLAEEGVVLPWTPLKRHSEQGSSSWARAGEVKGLFPFDKTEFLGDPICGDCGGKLVGNQCGKCNTAAKRASTLEAAVIPPPPPIVKSDSAFPSIPLNSIPAKFREFIQVGERVRYASNPSRQARALSMLLVSILPALLFLFYAASLIRVGFPYVALVLFFIGSATVSALCYLAHLQWKHRYYIITDSRTIISQGIFNVAVKIVFNHNIQMIAVNTGIIDRWLSLNTIQLSTSSSGGGPSIFAAFPGMSAGNLSLRWVPNAPTVVSLISSAG